MSGGMELGANGVHIWLAQISSIPASAIAGYPSLMNPAEQARNLRYRKGPLRDADKITRALLRTVLSQYDDHPPQRWEFATQSHGRPVVAMPATGLHFNLSHSTQWIACAVTRIPMIGVDIERCQRNVDVLRLARRFFSPKEYRAVLECSGVERRQRFFAYWTLKEAYIKARGEGISLGLNKFSFGFSAAGAIGIECDEQLQDNPDAWHFMLSPHEGDHRLALAVKPPERTRTIDVQYFLTVPLLSVENYAGPMRLRPTV